MKIFIERITGMGLHYDSNTKQILLDGEEVPGQTRYLKDMKDVLYDREWADSKSPDRRMYYMFRDICRPEDRERIEASGYRYDITVIPPDMMGKEYVKTYGHMHPRVPGSQATYTEIYQVLNGTAVFVLQKQVDDGSIEFVHIKAKSGESVIVPPGYSHVTINPSEEILILSNWVSRDFKSDYKPVKETEGLAFYLLKEDNENDTWVRNSNYGSDVRRYSARPIKPEILGLKDDEPIYSMISNPERLLFLNDPDSFEILFKKALDTKTLDEI